MSGDGGRSLFYAEPVTEKRFPGKGSTGVHIVREATLTPDLSGIEDRRLRSIRVRLDGGSGEATPVEMSREFAEYLRDALSHALDATEGEIEL